MQISEEKLAKLKARGEKAAADWFKDNEDKIEFKIKQQLDSAVVDIVAKLLGFNNQWGRWEIDHCNGRNGNSAAGDFIQRNAKEGVDKWLSQIVFDLPTMPAGMLKSLRAEYKNTLEDELRNLLVQKAREDAQKMFENIIKDSTGDSGD
jgi:hypothetical protein